ncbi:MAG: transporter substrate-binding domain-containing protein [Desulfobacteraceae bacterium]|nr:transporter substrate-binding domain-containing protein [Desulfobacteraceae bacterium]
MKKLFLGISFILCAFLLNTSTVTAADTIRVGGYLFPPFVEVNKGKYSGITIDLIDELNKFQEDYTFVFVNTSPKRRYTDSGKGKFDIMMFEDKNWGWKDKPVDSSDIFLKGGEVYITKADPSKDQSYFDNLKDKSFAVILGYHYGFADFNADDKYLKDNFDIQLGMIHDSNIKKVLVGRCDVSVVTISYLKKFLKENPDKAGQLLLSDKLDQEYNHTILVKKDTAIDVLTINKLLSQMKEKGVLNRVWEKYGIQ